MLGDDEHPISLVFETEQVGAHVYVRVRAGVRGMRGLSGVLTFRPEEWAVLENFLDGLYELHPGSCVLDVDSFGEPVMVHYDDHPIEIKPMETRTAT